MQKPLNLWLFAVRFCIIFSVIKIKCSKKLWEFQCRGFHDPDLVLKLSVSLYVLAIDVQWTVNKEKLLYESRFSIVSLKNDVISLWFMFEFVKYSNKYFIRSVTKRLFIKKNVSFFYTESLVQQRPFLITAKKLS